MQSQVSSLSLDDVRKRSEHAGEPSWLLERRLTALRAFEVLPLPKYSRTDLDKFDLAGLATRALGGAARATYGGATREGVIMMDLATAIKEHEDLVRPHLTDATVRPENSKVEALHAALWNTGTLMYVPKGVELDEPLVVDVTVGPDGTLAHTLLIAEPLSKVSVVERWRSAGGPTTDSLVSNAVEVVARDGAKVQYASVQDLGIDVAHFAVKRAKHQRDAHVGWMDAQFGSKLTVSTVESLLSGTGASTQNLSAFFGAGKQHFDLTASALHRARHTSSDITSKGALADEAYAVFYGIVNIGPDAPDSSGHQHETTLLLSEDARADAIPKLDVENNDVSASHAAAVGQVDQDQMFYIRSRGLDEASARRTIVEGFFEPLLREIPLESVQEELRVGITRRLS